KDGREAVEKLRAAPAAFDVVLMDVHMPVLDGNEATRLIRGELGLVALPVIALTASALVAERLRAFEAGMNDFVSKPFDAEVLMRTVRRCVERARAGGLAGVPEDAAPPAPTPASTPAPAAAPVASVLRPEDLAALIDALRERSASALPRLDELAPSLRAHLGEQRFGALERAMQTLRFRRAAEILEGADAGGRARNL
ncbi:MAG: response regulator, partial [Variovorax sp.]